MIKSFVLCLALTVSFQTLAQDSLRRAYKGLFHVGVAINGRQVKDYDARGEKIIVEEFDSISPENVLKWKALHPKESVYDFAAADAYVAFGERHQMLIIGHTLVWHEATPDWVFQDSHGNPATREALIGRLHDHIRTVVGRYKGRIHGWDVVNEALADDGSLRDTPWRRIIGDDYLEIAFKFAHEADPEAELYYNDYLLEKPEKRRGALALLTRLRHKGIHVTAVGLQGHYGLGWPSPDEIDATIVGFSKAGLKVNITELDIDVLPKAIGETGVADVNAGAALSPSLNPYPNGLSGEIQQTLATRYSDIFRVLVRQRANITRVTFWGVTDADSWLNNWPVKGRTNYPLLFDRAGRRKPAYDAVLGAAKLAPTSEN